MSVIALIKHYKTQSDVEVATAYIFAVDRLKMLEDQNFLNMSLNDICQIRENIKECKIYSQNLLIELEKREYNF